MKTRIAVFFGGRSPEHEVSVISGMQALHAAHEAGYEATTVYVDKQGGWWMGEALSRVETYRSPIHTAKGVMEVTWEQGTPRRLTLVGKQRSRIGRPMKLATFDVVLPVFHGGAGENGSFQGLMEYLEVPYAGSGVMASAIGMDKTMAKRIASLADIPVVASLTVREAFWETNPSQWVDRVEAMLGLPCIVKPARLGSSIGVTRVADVKTLPEAIEDALQYDDEVIIEALVPNLREINASVCRIDGEIRVAPLEEPTAADGWLSFDQKYRGAGARKSGQHQSGAKGPTRDPAEERGMASLGRTIPAELPELLTAEIVAHSIALYDLMGCHGVVRIDYLMDGSTMQVYFNEINTSPGSLSFYLWRAADVSFPRLVSALIDEALQLGTKRRGRISRFDANLLSEGRLDGIKGAKAS